MSERKGKLKDYIVDVSNIRIGQEFNNYKSLCIALGENPKRNNSKTSQTRNWERFFNYEKNGGRRLIITDIHEIPLPVEDNRKEGGNTVKYVDMIENLLLDLLARTKGNKILLSKNMLLKSLRMVNDNYTYGKMYPNRASQELEIGRDEIHDFYNVSDSLLQRNLDLAISRLDNKALITPKMVMCVGVIKTKIDVNRALEISGDKIEVEDHYGDKRTKFEFTKTRFERFHRKATDEEVNTIRDTERKYLLHFGCDSKNQLFSIGKNQEFYRLVTDDLFNKYSIFTYYKSYEISFNQKFISEEWKKVKPLLDNLMRLEMQSNLNDNIIDKLKENTDTRVENAHFMFSETGKIKYEIRISDQYIENNNKLIKNFICIDKELTKESDFQ